jgi:hypothetical protein
MEIIARKQVLLEANNYYQHQPKYITESYQILLQYSKTNDWHEIQTQHRKIT